MKNIIAANVANATVTASSESPDYLFSTALIDSRLSRTGRTLSDDSQWVLFTFAAAVDVDIVGIFGNNFTSAATVKIQANATDSWGSPSIDVEMTYTKNPYKTIDKGRDVGEWTHQFSSTESYKYWRISVNDAANPDTYIEMGFVFLDEAITFPGMAVNHVIKMNTTSEASFSDSGQAYGLKRVKYNSLAISYPAETNAQRKTVENFFYEVDVVTPYMMLLWESNLDTQRPLYMINTGLPEFQRAENATGVIWSSSHEVREVK